MKINKPKISIVLPCYNEENNILNTFYTISKSLKLSKISNYELIFIDDGSNDNSKFIINKIIKEYKKRVNFKKKFLIHNLGLGAAFKEGVKISSGDYLMFVPTDNSHPTKGLVEIFKSIKWEKKDSILLSYVKNKKKRSLTRQFISKIYTFILNFIFVTKIKYFNGLNIYPIKILKRHINQTTGFSFQTEIIISAIKDKYKYYYVGTTISERSAGSTRAFKISNIISVVLSVMKLIYKIYVK